MINYSNDSIHLNEFLSGGGEMGERIRSFDWSTTSLGPIEKWPQSLRTCIRIMLSSRQPIWIGWGKDLIKLYNDPYKAIVGGKHPWALGKPASIVWKDIWRDIEPLLNQVMNQGEGTYVESQLLIMERNGYPEETYYTFSYTPIPNDDGDIEGMFCANTDDTAQIINERQFRTLTRLGKRLTDCKTKDEVAKITIDVLSENPFDFPFAFFRNIIDKKAILTHSTPLGEAASRIAPIVDLTKEHAVARGIQEAINKHEPFLFDALNETVGTMPSGAWEKSPEKALILPITGNNEPNGLLIVGLSPYRLLEESYTGFFSLIADQVATSLADVEAIEQERKRAEALAQIDRAKTAFFSNISHEFRTPLTLMLAPIEDILQDQNTKVEDKEKLEVTYRNVQRLLKLVNSLLDFSKIEAGRMEINFEFVNLSKITIDLISVFRSAIEKANLQLVVDVQENIETLVDIDKWEKIVLNLISNAFKYTHHGSITITLKQIYEEIEFSVQDTGVGIEEDQWDKVFERFHRIQNTGGRSQEGTGIGLALVQELIKLHDGEISVESKLGAGSKFIVQMPIRKQLTSEHQGSASATISAKADVYLEEALKWLPDQNSNGQETTGIEINGIGKSTKHKYQIILADDNSDMRSYLSRLLSTSYQVTAVSNGQEALDLAISINPDLILSDVMMPVLDGFELVKRIKEHPQTRLTPIILLSARAGEEATIEGLQSGADDYLVKPFSAKELLTRVDSNIKIAESRIRAAKQLYQFLMDAPVAIAVLRGKDHFFELANDKYLEIAGKTNIIGKTLSQAFPELIDGPIKNILDEVFKSGIPFFGNEFKVELVRKGILEEVYFNFVYSALREKEQEITGIMVVAIEVSEMVKAKKMMQDNELRLEKEVKLRTRELEEMNTSLQQTNHQLEQFAFVTSHDLQEPLRKIQIFNDIILERFAHDLNDDVKKYISKSHEAAARMTGLIRDLLNFSRLSSGKSVFEMLDLNQVLENVEKDLEIIISEKNANIIATKLPTISAIPLQMQQLFYNLLNNAVKFSRENIKPIINITSRQLDSEELNEYPRLNKNKKYILIEFKDNGIGFNQEYAGKMFTIFQQLNERSAYSGYGIGLATCLRVVQNHKGLIFAKGVEQKGATFSVILPIVNN